jgi:hypothetical protein
MKTKGTVLLITFLTILIVLVVVLAVRMETEKTRRKMFESESPYREGGLRVEIIASTEDTFGYDILDGEKVLIHQPHVPAIPSLLGFKTREDARKVGDLVVKKISAKIFPPTVSVEELDSLGLFYR